MTDKKPLKKNPYMLTNSVRSKSLQMKEWAIKQIKAGSSPNKISQDIKRLFGEYVAVMTIYRWRKRYIAVTGEAIPSWWQLNTTTAKQQKNKSSNRIRRNEDVR